MREREVIAFVSEKRLLMKIKKTVRMNAPRSEFEREIRADDDVLRVPFCAQNLTQ